MERTILIGDYYVSSLPEDKFWQFFDTNRKQVFSEDLDINPLDLMSADEQSANKRLKSRMGTPWTLMLGIFCGDQCVGWSFGVQENAERFQMRNTALLPLHRGKGIYTALLPIVLDEVRSQGFQFIYSRHKATNNAVLVPKPKAGFVITSFEISDIFGVLVHLSYCFNPLRKDLLDFRVGKQASTRVQKYLESTSIVPGTKVLTQEPRSSRR